MTALPHPHRAIAFGDAVLPGEALKRFFSLRDWNPTTSESVALESACDRVIVEDFQSPYALPSRPHAATEGYAVRIADLESGRELRCSAAIRAKKLRLQSVRRGEAVRIPEGGTLPPGCDAVIPIAEAYVDRGKLQIASKPVRGDFVVPLGADVEAQKVLIPAGAVLTVTAIASLATFGLARVFVRMQPTIVLITFGDEVASQGDPLLSYQTFNVSRYVIGSALTGLGGRVVPLRAQPESAGGLIATLTMALSHADAIIICGDSDPHQRSEAAVAIEAVSSGQIVAEGVRMTPGSSTLIGVIGHVPIIAIPGTAREALLSFRVICDPIIRRLAGLPDRQSATVCDVGEAIRGECDRDSLVLVHVDGSTCWPISASVARSSVFAGTDGFVHVPAGAGPISSGERVTVESLSTC